MLTNVSPWLAQLKRKRPVLSLSGNETTDVAIVGGGIAGIATAYFTLVSTRQSVALIEAGKLAQGATGHNGGQMVGFFEKPFSEIVEQHGLEQAQIAQEALIEARDAVENILDTTGLTTPYYRVRAYVGFSTVDQLFRALEDVYLRHKVGINIEDIHIVDSVPSRYDIPSRYKGLYSLVPQQNLLALLETGDTRYIAVRASEESVMNSARFSEELAGFLLNQYPNRFRIFEETRVSKVSLERDGAELSCGEHTVQTRKVVLCTNGFELLDIENRNGFPLNARFHEQVHGIVGYMAGYLEPLERSPQILEYFEPGYRHGGPYIYVTRRPYELEKNRMHNLVCIGGPELPMPEKGEYLKDSHVYEEATLRNIENFLKRTLKHFPEHAEFRFHWHGLMGYTKNNLRLVGVEPCNEHLLYNLGCNGVGLLSSVYGAKRIARILKGEKLGKTPFDPVDTRCMIK